LAPFATPPQVDFFRRKLDDWAGLLTSGKVMKPVMIGSPV
jgi:hypothetical protein